MHSYTYIYIFIYNVIGSLTMYNGAQALNRTHVYNVCDKLFNQRGSLTIYQRTRTVSRPNPSEVCDKNVTRVYGLAPVCVLWWVVNIPLLLNYIPHT